ncbi:MAG: epoxyqueuosine reductase QueH, partial [Clostridia bacterium]
QNADKWLLNLIEENKKLGIKPNLLLHSCCSPCSSYVILSLLEAFKITVFYYNPNITDNDEYEKRLKEQEKLIKIYNKQYSGSIKFLQGDYNSQRFLDLTKNYENLPEGGQRCTLCYNLRLTQTALTAKKMNFDYFTTTLSVSPFKNSKKLNEIGEALQNEYMIKYLYADFKKRDGYKKSILLSKKYELYRQNFCGCIFSQQYYEKNTNVI